MIFVNNNLVINGLNILMVYQNRKAKKLQKKDFIYGSNVEGDIFQKLKSWNSFS